MTESISVGLFLGCIPMSAIKRIIAHSLLFVFGLTFSQELLAQHIAPEKNYFLSRNTLQNNFQTTETKIVALSQDRFLSVWFENSSSDFGGWTRIMGSVSNSDGSWGSPFKVNSISGVTNQSVREMNIATDSNNVAHIFWSETNSRSAQGLYYPAWDIYLASLSLANLTPAPTRIFVPINKGEASLPKIAFNKNGAGLAVFSNCVAPSIPPVNSQSSRGACTLYKSAFTNGAWLTPAIWQVFQNMSSISSVKFDSQDNAVVAWTLHQGYRIGDPSGGNSGTMGLFISRWNATINNWTGTKEIYRSRDYYKGPYSQDPIPTDPINDVRLFLTPNNEALVSWIIEAHDINPTTRVWEPYNGWAISTNSETWTTAKLYPIRDRRFISNRDGALGQFDFFPDPAGGFGFMSLETCEPRDSAGRSSYCIYRTNLSLNNQWSTPILWHRANPVSLIASNYTSVLSTPTSFYLVTLLREPMKRVLISKFSFSGQLSNPLYIENMPHQHLDLGLLASFSGVVTTSGRLGITFSHFGAFQNVYGFDVVRGISTNVSSFPNSYPCNDQRDNDGDGLIDLADSGCSYPEDDNENGGSLKFSIRTPSVVMRGANLDFIYEFENVGNESLNNIRMLDQNMRNGNRVAPIFGFKQTTPAGCYLSPEGIRCSFTRLNAGEKIAFTVSRDSLANGGMCGSDIDSVAVATVEGPNPHLREATTKIWLNCPGYPTPTPLASATPTATATFTSTNTPIPTATHTATFTPSSTPTPLPTNTFTSTPVPPTKTFTPIATNTPINTATHTPSKTPTSTPVPPTNTSTPVPTNTPVNTAINTATNTPTNTLTSTPVPPTNTSTAVPTNTPINTSTNTATSTPTNTLTSTPIPPTNTSTPIPTKTPVNTVTNTPTNTPTNTVTSTPVAPTSTSTPVPTNTSVNTATNTPTNTQTSTPVPPTSTATAIPATNTPTNTPTATATGTTAINQPTNTPLSTSTATASSTATLTPTMTPSNTPKTTNTPGSTATQTPTNTATSTPTATGTITVTPVTTASATATSTPSQLTTKLIPLLDCISESQDGKLTALFGYENFTKTDIVVDLKTVINISSNYFVPGLTNRGQISTFKPGRIRNAFSVPFDGNPLTWTVKPSAGIIQSVVVSSNSVRCAKVEPRIECQTLTNSTLSGVTLGYSNTNSFSRSIPVGIDNFFAGSRKDYGQPSAFFSGSISSVFSVPLTEGSSITWNLEGKQVSNTANLPRCLDSRGCFDTPVITVKGSLDKTALFLSDSLNRIAKRFLALNLNEPTAQRDFLRATKSANRLLAEARSLLLEYPEVVTTCPDALNTCATVDNQIKIDNLRSLYRRIWVKIKRIKTRIIFSQEGVTRKGDRLFNMARNEYRKAIITIEQLPRFASSCSK